MALRRTLLLLLFAFAQASAALAAPQNGWWWNPAENGRGFFIEIVDGFAYIGAYVYAPDGRADWVVSQGTMASPTSYSGRLLSFRGGQTLVGSHRAPGPATDAGAISIQFTDDRHATLTWPGGSTAIERLAFGPADPAPLPRTGWWWDETQPGTGYSIEVQGSTLFVVGFMYDDSGEPVWYYASGAMASPNSFTAPVYRFAGGQAIGAPYRAPAAPVRIGTMSLEFSGTDEAELTLADEPGGAKRQRGGPLRPTLPPPRIVLPNSWTGAMTMKHRIETSSLLGISYFDTTIVLSGTWSDPLPTLARRGAAYSFSGLAHISNSTSDRLQFGICTLSASLNTAPPPSATLVLTVYENGDYELKVDADFDFSASGICAAGGSSAPITLRLSAHMMWTRTASVNHYRIYNSAPRQALPLGALNGVLIRSAWWDFEAGP